MNKKLKNIIVIVFLYVLTIVVISYFYYKNIHQEFLRTTDQKLISAIYSTHAIIGEDFHNKAINENSISEEKDYQMAVKLYEYAKKIDVEYLYSFKRFGDEILFVVSSATEEELALNTYEASYFSKYPEMDDAIEQAFNTQEQQTAEYNDRWGSFRSIFIPFKTQSGDVYVIGADISTQDIESAVMKDVSYAYAIAILLGLLITPAIILLINSMRREWQAKYQLFFRDELTGLPNRNQLMQDLEKSEDTHLAFIDIKKFSDVINIHGPAIGDHILKQFACRLTHFHHPSLKNYKVYRVSGDVFAIFENQPLDPKEVSKGTKNLIEYLVDYRYQVSSSEFIKLAVTVGGVNQTEDALMLANMALEEAKNRNIQSFVYDRNSAFLPEIYQKNFEIKQKLQLALDEDRLVPFFQPIFNVTDKKVAKYECLARVVDHSGQVEVTPDCFIPVARRARMYAEITRRMVAKSIAVAKDEDFIISINLSISDIMNQATRKYLYQSVKDSKIAARIQFEILETEAIEDVSVVRGFINKLQNLGAKVGIDDMGRSYSNFDRLTLLPFDFIKIDGSIITLIENDEEAQTITRDIVLLAHKHNIKVTAEYCHNEATTQMAIQLGVDFLQGFHLGKPENNILTG